MDVREINVSTGQIVERQYTLEELVAIASAPQPDPVQQVKNQIDFVEVATKMNRAAREGLLLLIEDKAMRDYSVDRETAQAGLYAGNVAYRKVKDVDIQIAALRSQIGEL